MEKQAFVYARISDDKTGAGLGVARQLDDCRALAAQLGYVVVGEYADNDISAYSGKRRPGYRAMLERLGECDAVVAWHSDRLHRSPIELEEYISLCGQHGVVTQTVKGGELDLATPEGMLRAGLLGQVARYESAHKAERVQRAQKQAAMAGKWLGGRRPFGWVFVDGEPTLEPTEAAAVAKAFKGVLAGQSLGSIIREMNELGLITTADKAWGYAQLRQALLRPRNAGLASWHGEIVGQSEFPAIVSEDVWRAVKSILEDPTRRRSSSNKAVYLLSGIAECHCGLKVKSAIATGRKGNRYSIYRCPASGRGHVGKRTSNVDDLVNKWVVGWLATIQAYGVKAVDHQPQIEALETEASALRRRLDDAAVDYAEGKITGSQLHTITERLRMKQEEIESNMSNLRQAASQVSPTQPIQPAELSGPIAEEWMAKHIDDRRDEVRRLFTIVLLRHNKGSARVFDPNTVRIYPKGYRPAEDTHEERLARRARIEASLGV